MLAFQALPTRSMLQRPADVAPRLHHHRRQYTQRRSREFPIPHH
jgi:hypothetical protein